MCFSASADFIGSAVLGGIGIATLREVQHPREVLFASLPCLFALHQFTEGFVWLGLDGKLSAADLHSAGALYLLYAHGLLPVLLPLSVFLLEPTRKRQKRMLSFLLLGSALTLYMLWGLIAYPFTVAEHGHSIVYFNPVTITTSVAVLYVFATCGSLFFSGFRDLVVLAWLNLIGLLVVMVVMRYAFTSIWCAYAAVVSVIIYVFFRSNRVARITMYDLVPVL
jgi:hypothetical protein